VLDLRLRRPPMFGASHFTSIGLDVQVRP